jgi:hypothetical protein
MLYHKISCFLAYVIYTSQGKASERPWSSIGLWDVEAPTFTVGSEMAVRLSDLCTGRPLPPGKFLILISVRDSVHPKAIARLERSSDLIKNETSDIPTYSKVPKLSTIPRAALCTSCPMPISRWIWINTSWLIYIYIHNISNFYQHRVTRKSDNRKQ